MGDAAKPGATYEDLLAVPDHLVGELINGALITSPRPAALQALVAPRLGVELGGAFHRRKVGPGRWIVIDEPELHLHGDVLVPDLAGWRRERMPELPHAAAFEHAPDWVCEVLSPATAATDRAEKRPIYARERVAHLWLVDPLAQTLDAYHLEHERWSLLGTWRDAARERVDPFAELELELAALWAR